MMARPLVCNLFSNSLQFVSLVSDVILSRRSMYLPGFLYLILWLFGIEYFALSTVTRPTIGYK